MTAGTDAAGPPPGPPSPPPAPAPVPARRTVAAVCAVLGATLAAVIAWTTPWSPLPGGPVTGAGPALDFTHRQIARSASFNAALDVPVYAGLATGLVLALVLGLTPLGARLLGLLARPVRRLGRTGGWGRLLPAVAVAAVTLPALLRLADLPFAVWSQSLLRRYGLSTEGWGAWATTQLTSYGVSAVGWLIALTVLYALIRRFPRHWWVGAAAGGFLFVVAGSFVYPVVVEPLFSSFRPMPAGPLRSDLLAMAHADGVQVSDVLVADASRRTTELNAYVSGFGSTRRIVVYDTLIRSEPRAEVELVVAHELGHAKHDDVLHGTLIGGLGVAAGGCLAYLVMTSPRLLRRAGVRSAADPRSIALLVAAAAVATQLAGPVQNLVSRRIEARADVHSLDLTRDPGTFVGMQRALAVRNLDDLSPRTFDYLMWNTHPTGPQRIALGRAWARRHHVRVPPPLAAAR